jgi:hypothetical protein
MLSKIVTYQLPGRIMVYGSCVTLEHEQPIHHMRRKLQVLEEHCSVEVGIDNDLAPSKKHV